ncbi:MAG: hypothetical protein IT393_11015 [Nitrospirae bacterium]|nr:hypothetical protein [Nitrospirota bacterium]
MKKYIFLLIIVSFLAGCGSGGGGSAPAGDNNGNTGGGKINPLCSRTGNVAKVKISKDGIYRIKYTDLYSECPSTSISFTTLSLSSQGVVTPIDVTDNNGNGYFEAGDYIEFYGKAIGRDDSRFRYTETNVYWLSVGEGTGKRIERRIAPAAGGPPLPEPSSFTRKLHVEEDTEYVQKNYPEIDSASDVREHWFWGDRIYPKPDDKIPFTFSTRYIDKNYAVSIKLRVQSVSFDHLVKVYVNGYYAGQYVWNSQDPYDIDISGIPALHFNNGPNTLYVESVGGGMFYLDWFDVTYNRQYKAEHNYIEFTGSNLIKLSGFTSGDISVYEISDPVNPEKISIGPPQNIGTAVDPNFGVSFPSPYAEDRPFVAVAYDQMVPVIEQYTPSDIKSKNGDYIIITHPDFADAIKALAGYRSQQGYSVVTVRINDIYDQFSGGVESPHAIRAYLKYAYDNWAIRPQYVLLVGDATVDYKDLSGNGKNYMPAYLYNYPGLGEVPSDNWFVDVIEDVLPEMNIGRIPARSALEVSDVISKIISHEGSVKSGTVALIADDDNPNFEGLSDSISGIVSSSGYVPAKVYESTLQQNFKPAISSAINSNPLIVNYTGHGAFDDWANNMFSSLDVAELTNSAYPFVVALNCLNGYFVRADTLDPSIAEAFILARNKGAVAVLAPGSWGYLSDHDPLAQELYSIMLSENISLGEAVTRAKTKAYTNNNIMEDAVQTFIFFGDPATKLK